MIEFIEENYQWLSVLVFDLIIAIFALIRRVKIVQTPFDKVIAMLPGFIDFAESKIGAGKGSEKLELVLALAKRFYQSVGGSDDISDLLKVHVEAILSTPQKKGDSCEKKSCEL